ncbi:MAG: tRNA (cytidine(34)-2'-O)-methyltransferase [Candidatus Ozemobacter sibiricus]|jgi:tRNA (cytidine/uridine-2'-O-)-methyltransferase|uniref:Putative tRNA (cytidine(34)-2'-O)-methyltransferase n=1 Tax=Candidatus Ozemobacter sibiricus TaxID=2268124 RepID=A0A367ZJK8_9BACT|nr:MAG: tRNA (cytidine(34)-2'-O)-methyltransferase [Candidatus Ozemobacter sibiricus]
MSENGTTTPEIVPFGEWLTVALIHPDIPQNTGNIARLCLATGCRLVLVRPLGFRLTDPHLKRAGMDYWERIDPLIFDDLEDFLEWSGSRRVFALSAHARTIYTQPKYAPGDVLCLGSETEGLPARLLQKAAQEGRALRLPMVHGVRCLNVAASAAAVVYEAVRQLQGWT